VVLVVAGFFLGIGQPLTMSLIVQAVPDDARGTALAIRLFGNRVDQVATPAGAGLVAGAAGIAAAFWLLGGLLAVAAATVARQSG
jgi:sugar phosphate permease